MSLPVIELGEVTLFPHAQELWLQIAERQSLTTWTVAEAQAAVVYLQAWITEHEGKAALPHCRCGHLEVAHVDGICLCVLDCLCRGYEVAPGRDDAGAQGKMHASTDGPETRDA